MVSERKFVLKLKSSEIGIEIQALTLEKLLIKSFILFLYSLFLILRFSNIFLIFNSLRIQNRAHQEWIQDCAHYLHLLH